MSVGSITTTTTTLARQQTRPAAPGLPRWAACFGPMLGYDTTPQTPRPVAKQRTSSRHSASAEGGEPAVAEPEAPSPVEAALAEVEQRWGPGSVGRFARGTAALRLHVLWLGLAGLLLPPTQQPPRRTPGGSGAPTSRNWFGAAASGCLRKL